MLLTAWADGVGSNWVGFANLEKVNALLGIPSERDVLAVVHIVAIADDSPDAELGGEARLRHAMHEPLGLEAIRDELRDGVKRPPRSARPMSLERKAIR